MVGELLKAIALVDLITFNVVLFSLSIDMGKDFDYISNNIKLEDKVLVDNDTLQIVDINLVDKKAMLSNGLVVNTDFAIQNKIK